MTPEQQLLIGTVKAAVTGATISMEAELIRFFRAVLKVN